MFGIFRQVKEMKNYLRKRREILVKVYKKKPSAYTKYEIDMIEHLLFPTEFEEPKITNYINVDNKEWRW